MSIVRHLIEIAPDRFGRLQTNVGCGEIGRVDDSNAILLQFGRPQGFEDCGLAVTFGFMEHRLRVDLGAGDEYLLPRALTQGHYLEVMPSFYRDDGFKRSARPLRLGLGEVLGNTPALPWPNPVNTAEQAFATVETEQSENQVTQRFLNAEGRVKGVSHFTAGAGGIADTTLPGPQSRVAGGWVPANAMAASTVARGSVRVGEGIAVTGEGTIHLTETVADWGSSFATGRLGHPLPAQPGQRYPRLVVWGTPAGVGQPVAGGAHAGRYRLSLAGAGQVNQPVALFDHSVFIVKRTVTTSNYPGTYIEQRADRQDRLTNGLEHPMRVAGLNTVTVQNNPATGLYYSLVFSDAGYILLTSDGNWHSEPQATYTVPENAAYAYMNVRNAASTPITPQDLAADDFVVLGRYAEATRPLEALMDGPLYDGSSYTFEEVVATGQEIAAEGEHQLAFLYLAGAGEGNFDDALTYPALRVGCIGASNAVLSLDADGNRDTGYNYPTVLGQLLGCSVHNHGVVGSTVSSLYDAPGRPSMITNLATMEDGLDLVVAQLSSNDYKQAGEQLGKPGDETTTTYYGACHVFFTNLRKKYPTALLVATNGPRVPAPTESMAAHMRAGLEVARTHGVPVIDYFTGNDPVLAQIGQNLPDGTHMNHYGAKLYGTVLAAAVRYLLQRHPQPRSRLRYATHGDVQQALAAALARFTTEEWAALPQRERERVALALVGGSAVYVFGTMVG